MASFPEEISVAKTWALVVFKRRGRGIWKGVGGEGRGHCCKMLERDKSSRGEVGPPRGALPSFFPCEGPPTGSNPLCAFSTPLGCLGESRGVALGMLGRGRVQTLEKHGHHFSDATSTVQASGMLVYPYACWTDDPRTLQKPLSQWRLILYPLLPGTLTSLVHSATSCPATSPEPQLHLPARAPSSHPRPTPTRALPPLPCRDPPPPPFPSSLTLPRPRRGLHSGLFKISLLWFIKTQSSGQSFPRGGDEAGDGPARSIREVLGGDGNSDRSLGYTGV